MRQRSSMPRPARFLGLRRWRWIGFLYFSIVRTPSIDKLASCGVRFASAYTASPVCCPARAAMATGRFPNACAIHATRRVGHGAMAIWPANTVLQPSGDRP